MAKSKRRVRVKYKGRLILLILIFVLICYLIVKGIMFGAGLLFGNGIGLDKVEIIEAKRTEDNIVRVDTNSKKEAVAVVNEGKTTLYDKDGKELWDNSVEAVDIELGQEVIVLSTKDEGTYVILDYNGQEIYRSNIGYKITDIKMNLLDYSLLMFDKGVVLIDNQGEEVTRVNIEDGQVMDVEFQTGEQGFLLDVMAVNNDGYDTNIITYNYSGNVVSGKAIKSTSYFDIESVDDDKVVMLGERIDVLDKNRNMVNKAELQGEITRFEVRKDALTGFNVFVSLINDSEVDIASDPKSTFIIKALDSELKEKYKVEIPGEVLGIRPYIDRSIVFSARTIFIIDNKGKTILKKEINKDVIDVQWLSEDRILIIDKTGITIASLDNGGK